MNDTDKLTWSRLVQALTDEDKALNFPIKYPAIDLDKSTKQNFILVAGIIAGGLIVSALIKANSGKK